MQNKQQILGHDDPRRGQLPSGASFKSIALLEPRRMEALDCGIAPKMRAATTNARQRGMERVRAGKRKTEKLGCAAREQV
jgi:hypothetical protein